MPDWDSIQQNEHIQEWLKQSKSLRILVTGKTGVGKSALVNNIVGKDIAKEGHGLDPQTSEVTKYSTVIQDVNVIIYDSPGLQDGTENEKQYLRDLEEKCEKVDLVLYCTEMNASRITSGDVAAIKKFSTVFGGSQFWTNALFVLTFANELRVRRKTSKSLNEFFEERLVEWTAKLREVLYDVGIEKEIADKVPVVPAGFHDNPSLPGGREYWLGDLWSECLNRIAESSKPAFLKINWDRLRTPQEVDIEDLILY